MCGFADDGMHILDVWDSEQAFNTSFEQRIGPAVEEVGIEGQPDVKFFPTLPPGRFVWRHIRE